VGVHDELDVDERGVLGRRGERGLDVYGDGVWWGWGDAVWVGVVLIGFWERVVRVVVLFAGRVGHGGCGVVWGVVHAVAGGQ
jgi:hypothetical protein